MSPKSLWVETPSSIVYVNNIWRWNFKEVFRFRQDHKGGAKYWNLWFYTEDWSYHSLSIGLCDILRTCKDHASEPQLSRTEVLNLWFETAPKHT